MPLAHFFKIRSFFIIPSWSFRKNHSMYVKLICLIFKWQLTCKFRILAPSIAECQLRNPYRGVPWLLLWGHLVTGKMPFNSTFSGRLLCCLLTDKHCCVCVSIGCVALSLVWTYWPNLATCCKQVPIWNRNMFRELFQVFASNHATMINTWTYSENPSCASLLT